MSDTPDPSPSHPTVLITGCSDGGIGSALAAAFHARGFHVFATARSVSKMTHLEALTHKTLFELDVESQSSIEAAVKVVAGHGKATSGNPKLNCLVNNAGLNLNCPALDSDLDYARRMFDVNFWGMVHVTHAFMPLLIESEGTVVNISSMAGVLNVPWSSFYNASKAAMRMYSETLRVELAPLNVNVVTVMTGVVDTKIFANAPHDALPETSHYKAAGPQIAERARGAAQDVLAMPADVFARRVVDDVLRGRRGMTWRGNLASFAWFLHSWFPTWLADRAFALGTGLEKI
ncbi:SDR family oxidoreductase [Aspergillus lucknowensis]|uniref:Uncharacterized protein n=1 Tax=Aspergillus lucknowensis TaxID=176173 RepID=A0ABR4LMW4_9EURO